MVNRALLVVAVIGTLFGIVGVSLFVLNNKNGDTSPGPGGRPALSQPSDFELCVTESVQWVNRAVDAGSPGAAQLEFGVESDYTKWIDFVWGEAYGVRLREGRVAAENLILEEAQTYCRNAVRGAQGRAPAG